MKFRLEHFTIRHYIRYMRRQGKHVQHVHAAVFAGVITALIAGFILYTDYGFWHETYIREDEAGKAQEPVTLSGSLERFMSDAKTKFSSIGSSSANLLEGKETYKKEGE